jgi:hypothetical protein
MTRKSKQPQNRYEKDNDLFTAMHSTRGRSEERLRIYKKSLFEERDKENSFIPVINSNSERMARRKRFERYKYLYVCIFINTY